MSYTPKMEDMRYAVMHGTKDPHVAALEFDRALEHHEAKVRREVLVAVANNLSRMTEGANREGTRTWAEPVRDVYSVAIEEAAEALRLCARNGFVPAAPSSAPPYTDTPAYDDTRLMEKL